MSTGRKFRAIPGSDWLLSTEDCVSCPECAFTFDAMHCDDDGLTYTCPACSEQALLARAVGAEAALRTIEYVWDEGYGGNICPSCGMDDSVPHDRSCTTAAALAGQEGKP